MNAMRRWWKWAVVLTIGLVILAGCAAAPPRTASDSATSGEETPVQLLATVVVERAASSAGELDIATTERMIVVTGNLSLIVKDTASSMEQIKQIAAAAGGYVVTSNAYDDGEAVRGNINIRVPADKFDAVMQQVKALAERVRNESINGEYVTEEYTDLSARLRNLEATEQELLELLATVRQQGGKAEDILAVYRELTNIRGQIEQLKGRTQYLERMTALSTIQIELIPSVSAQPIASPAWQPSETLRESVRALVKGLQSLATFLIRFVIGVLPILILIAILIVLIVLLIRWIVRRLRKKAK